MNYILLFLLVWSKNNNNSPLPGWSTTSSAARWITQDYYFIFLILILNQGFCCLVQWSKFSIQEERDPRETKREAERGDDELKRKSWPDGFEPCCVDANTGRHEKDKPVLITVHHNKLSIVTLGWASSVHWQWSKSELTLEDNEHMLICT